MDSTVISSCFIQANFHLVSPNLEKKTITNVYLHNHPRTIIIPQINAQPQNEFLKLIVLTAHPS